jgi:hypothetical protein
MKNTFKKIVSIQLLVMIIALLLPTIVHADPTDPGSDPDVPIDGGLSILIAAGVGYGINELRKKKAGKSDK